MGALKQYNRSAVIPLSYSPAERREGAGLPSRADCLAYFRAPDLSDTVGVSVSDYADIDASVRDIFFIDESTLRGAADIYALAMASPLLNAGTMIGTSAKGVALYKSGTDQATLTKAQSYFRTLPGKYYHGVNIYGEYQTWTGLPDADFYVDSVNGNDSNAGTSPGAAFATISELLTHVVFDNTIIGVAAGSYFREELNLGELTGCTVFGYGAGKRPIFDAADVASNGDFSLIGGRTNTYQITWTHDIYEQSFLSVWRDGERLTYVADEVTCEATPGSFTVPFPAASPTVCKVHPPGSVSPVTDGAEYEITRRDFGIYAGYGSAVKFVRAKRNGHNDGSIVLGENTYGMGIIAEDGVKHNLYQISGTLEDCVGWKMEPSSTRTSQTTLISFQNLGNGYTWSLKNILISKGENAGTAIYCHTNDVVNYSLIDLDGVSCNGPVNIGSNPVSVNLETVAVTVDAATAMTLTTQSISMDKVRFDMRGAPSVVRPVILDSPGSNSISNILMLFEKGTTGGLIYGAFGPTTLRHSVIYRANGASGYAQGVRPTAGTPQVDISNTIFFNVDKPLALLGTNFDPTNNVYYPATADMNINGTEYTSIAAYKSAWPAKDVNTITDDPLFNDPGNGDFSLQVGSPAIAIDAGLEQPDAQYLEILSDELLEQW